ncbi:MAG: potassium-transporting ATPase subunit F [Actinobacteria bacterium]|jgi:K+-transporting ATPase KdpF subunit|nr:MAG: potassium-transporting ATPase subunit F [Actinomycetota bacterium]
MFGAIFAISRADNAIALALAVLVAIYLVVVLVWPEKF